MKDQQRKIANSFAERPNFRSRNTGMLSGNEGKIVFEDRDGNGPLTRSNLTGLDCFNLFNLFHVAINSTEQRNTSDRDLVLG